MAEQSFHKAHYLASKIAEIPGFKLAIDNGTLKVSTLELISRKLKVPMAYWFQDEDKLIMAETEITYGDNPAAIIKELRGWMNQCLNEKQKLQERIEELEKKLKERGQRP